MPEGSGTLQLEMRWGSMGSVLLLGQVAIWEKFPKQNLISRTDNNKPNHSGQVVATRNGAPTLAPPLLFTPPLLSLLFLRL